MFSEHYELTWCTIMVWLRYVYNKLTACLSDGETQSGSDLHKDTIAQLSELVSCAGSTGFA